MERVCARIVIPASSGFVCVHAMAMPCVMQGKEAKEWARLCSEPSTPPPLDSG
jgi:hypothetical protein